MGKHKTKKIRKFAVKKAIIKNNDSRIQKPAEQGKDAEKNQNAKGKKSDKIE